MATGFDWSLPSFDDSGGGWTDPGGYDLGSSGDESWTGSGSSYTDDTGFDFSDDDWYVDSSSSGGSADDDSSIFSDIWSWVKSDQGVSLLGGAAKGLYSMWAADKAFDRQKQMAKIRSGGGGGGGPNAAALQDARIKAHNASINTPMNMDLVEYKKP